MTSQLSFLPNREQLSIMSIEELEYLWDRASQAHLMATTDDQERIFGNLCDILYDLIFPF